MLDLLESSVTLVVKVGWISWLPSLGADAGHPSPPERWFMFFAHLFPNAKKLYGERPRAKLAILDGAATAFKMSGLGNLYSGFDPISHAALMVQIGHDLDRLELDGRRLFLKTPMGFRKVRVA